MDEVELLPIVGGSPVQEISQQNTGVAARWNVGFHHRWLFHSVYYHWLWLVKELGPGLHDLAHSIARSAVVLARQDVECG